MYVFNTLTYLTSKRIYVKQVKYFVYYLVYSKFMFYLCAVLENKYNPKVSKETIRIMELSGKIIALVPAFTTQSGKVKNGFVLETSGDYPQRLPFDVWGEDKWRAMNVQVGASVAVSFDLSGREHGGRYFVSLNAWRVTLLGGGATTEAPQASVPTQASPQPQPQAQVQAPQAPQGDCLPF